MDWNKARSMVAGPHGLDVVFEDDNAQLGATRLPYGGMKEAPFSPGRQTNASLPSTTTMTCTDSALKTYKVVPTKFLQKPPQPGEIVGVALGFTFKACSDTDAWAVVTSGYTQEFFAKLQCLDAKPGYVSVWVDVNPPLKMPGIG